MNFEKPRKWRNKKYTDWVKSLNCSSCYRPATDPHHINVRGFGKGIGTKVSDCLCIPLCRECHDRLDMGSEEQMRAALWTLEKALLVGVLKCD